MTCDQVRAYILADYTDGEAPERVRADIEAHISSCGACRAYKEEVMKAVTGPLAQVALEKVPETAWMGIEERITRRPWLNIPIIIPVPRPVYAATLVLVVVLSILTTLVIPRMRYRDVNIFLAEQADYLASLSSEERGANGDTSMGFGTSVETYFL